MLLEHQLDKLKYGQASRICLLGKVVGVVKGEYQTHDSFSITRNKTVPANYVFKGRREFSDPGVEAGNMISIFEPSTQVVSDGMN